MDTGLIAPKYLRARIAGLNNLKGQLQAQLPTADPITKKELELNIAYLRNGAYPEDADPDGIELMVMKDQDFSNQPLSFTELITLNTWFELHPEKVCGQEVLTSSRDFPLTVKGDRKDVEKAIAKTLAQAANTNLELEFLALELELKLLSL